MSTHQDSPPPPPPTTTAELPSSPNSAADEPVESPSKNDVELPADDSPEAPDKDDKATGSASKADVAKSPAPPQPQPEAEQEAPTEFSLHSKTTPTSKTNNSGGGGGGIHQDQQQQQQQQPPPPSPSSSRRVSKRIKIRRKSRPTPKIFRDAISVIIPINVTADLKVAIERTRQKRIQSIYKRFPALKKAVKKWKNSHRPEIDNDEDNMDEDDHSSKADDPMDEDDDDDEATGKKDPNNASSKNKLDGKENNKPSKKKKKILSHVPQPEQYGSVLDYLEAKYVRGVMLGDDDADGGSMEGGSEGQGSVYSGGSFLDDADLQRDVAEQVMANTTLTKVELEDEDGEFFVNVGALEVEDNQYGDNYDPLQDKEAAKVTKKRKKSQTSAAATELSKTTIQKKKKTTKAGDSEDTSTLGQSSKSKMSFTSTGTQKKKPGRKPANSAEGPAATTPKKEKEADDTEERKKLKAEAKKAKTKSDGLFKKLAAIVKTMTKVELPRRKTKLMVSLTCPANKKGGDDVTFTNPHDKGQRLRAKIPKNCLPGGTFKVSVPIKQEPVDEDDETDHNNLSRDFQELLDDYARAYDHWCSAQSVVVKNFALLKEKQAKYDALIELFPKNLMTPVTVEYFKKIVRRARQNRHKRRKTAELKTDTASQGTKDDDDDDEFCGEEEEKDQADDDEEGEDEEDETAPEPKKRIVDIPTMGSVFPTVPWKESDFLIT